MPSNGPAPDGPRPDPPPAPPPPKWIPGTLPPAGLYGPAPPPGYVPSVRPIYLPRPRSRPVATDGLDLLPLVLLVLLGVVYVGTSHRHDPAKCVECQRRREAEKSPEKPLSKAKTENPGQGPG